MPEKRVPCDFGGLLSCDVADSSRFVFSRYFVPLQLMFADSTTPILPGYKKAFLEELVAGGVLEPGRISRAFAAGDQPDTIERNSLRLALAKGAPADGAIRGPDGERGGLLGELAEVTAHSRNVDLLLRRVGEEVRSSLDGVRAVEERGAVSTSEPLPSNVLRRPREETDEDWQNLLLGLLRSDMGYLFLDRTRIRPKGFAIGEHVYALGLAPGEEVTLEQKTFAKRQTTYEEQNEQETQFDLELASTLTTELQEGFEATKSHNDTSGLNVSHTGQYTSPDFFWGKINASHTIGFTRNVTDASQETNRRSAKDSQSASSKTAAKYRTLHKTTFKVTEERGFESTSKRVIRNPNRYTPITLHYFKILQRLELSQERYGVRLCWSPAVHDPAGAFFTQLEVGRKKIIGDATATIPPAPTPPVKLGPGGATPGPVEERWLHSSLTDADKWGIWGDQRHDYSIDIPFPSDVQWDGVAESVRLTVDTGRTDYNVAVKGMPIVMSSEGGTVLRVVVHVGAPVCINGPKIFFQVAARFVKAPSPQNQSTEDATYAAAVAAYQTALREWEDKRDEIMAAARTSAAAWELDMLQRMDPVTEMINQIIKGIFPPSVRDELWEIDLWQRLFDWSQASYVAYPSWWAEGAMRNPTRDASDFVNASWAKLYLPIRVGMELVALRWIFGKKIDGALDPAVEASFDDLLEDLAAYRTESFGDSQEIALTNGGEPSTEYGEPGTDSCPSIRDIAPCIGRWTELMPTDGTHVEVIQGSSTAADSTTARKADDDAALRKARLKDLTAETALKHNAGEHITEPTDVTIRIGMPSERCTD
ncbi:hypothetical protein OHA02_52215 [Streptomyces phaeochromogenes]|nr:hypothetical protein [Streptomyces phaeochromogenes]